MERLSQRRYKTLGKTNLYYLCNVRVHHSMDSVISMDLKIYAFLPFFQREENICCFFASLNDFIN